MAKAPPGSYPPAFEDHYVKTSVERKRKAYLTWAHNQAVREAKKRGGK